MAYGRVALVGAGPGHPGLLTERARALVEQADVVVYDRLVSPRLLMYAKPEAALLYAGKAPGCHALAQRDIEAMLVDLARDHALVVRLKGGDPLVFGRGAEEAAALRAAGVPFELVPGVTSAVAVPAFAGIPVTLRGVSRSFAVATGHAGDGLQAHLDAIAGAETLVLLMGVAELPRIAEELAARGVSPDTPAAMVEWGSRAKQRSVRATLATLAAEAKRRGIGSPAVIVIGHVAADASLGAWFESLPRFGERHLLFASSAREALAHAARLEAEGAEVMACTWDRARAVRVAELEAAVSMAAHGRSVGFAFCTALGVEAWRCAVQRAGFDLRRLGNVKLAAVDGYVAHAVRERGLVPDARSLGEMARLPVEVWFVEAQSGGRDADVEAACAASGADVRSLHLLEPRPAPAVPARWRPCLRAWRDVVAEWLADGPAELWALGDPALVRPLAVEVGLGGDALRRADAFGLAADEAVCGA
ncbi:uroporphyrinogen-III C-methyltransferase [Alicyclobacillus sendaiensis]|uniref:uroporphyrinogen-III C-methyltransferase n=1 Tax=Alicyclobacillus sendaiensis PA2 TaxID=3029425 RepID=A0ABT6XWQ6_ALISE|nr:uroporphyrinogen-III C-methyltransferase [Alicyclobacillus sendaiensis]MDI9259528.1 uroporphyrinogen-III C-methyltransferase [Alicyclobacillus sendaiensis PA2]